MPTSPLNQILYGPPGTGKTFHTIQQAVQIIEGQSFETKVAKDKFDAYVQANRIRFVTFHQSYSYEDFVEGIRPVFDTAEGQARYECRNGILKDIALDAFCACLELAKPGEITFEDVWSAFVEKVEDSSDLQLSGPGSSKLSVNITNVGNVAGINTAGTAKTTYRASRRNIEIVWKQTRNGPQATHSMVHSLLGKYSQPTILIAVVEELKRLESEVTPATSTASYTPREAVESFLAGSDDYRLKSAPYKPYVLIIDEINRGNISKILGELITLLEEDKRLGQPMALTVTLPYSGECFALPPNLYIIGTMNTADKSLALVDVALRRRFKFKEMAPNFKALPTQLSQDFQAVLQELNRRITLRKDREHRIGYAYFKDVGASQQAFNEVFRSSIIPLLQEYFYNDWVGLRFVLGEKGDNGKFILPLPGSNHSEARNKWQWIFDDEPDALEKLDVFAALKENYSSEKSDGH